MAGSDEALVSYINHPINIIALITYPKQHKEVFTIHLMWICGQRRSRVAAAEVELKTMSVKSDIRSVRSDKRTIQLHMRAKDAKIMI